MVELTGTLVNTEANNGKVVDEWRIPALSQGLARQQAMANARLKGRSNVSVTNVQRIESGDIPGQSIYLVVTESTD